MELRHLEIFNKVVDFRSFSKAAEALYLTQPTISSHIKALEDALGIKLLDRVGREIKLTQGGGILYGYSKKIVRLKKEAKRALERYAGEMSGKLEMGGSTIPGV